MTPNEIYDVLVEECGASEINRRSFEACWPCGEFRFGGLLGWGGKIFSKSGHWNPERHEWVWSPEVFVGCYREDETPQRWAMVTRANSRLKRLMAAA